MSNIDLFQSKKYCVVQNVASAEIVEIITKYALLHEAYSFTADSNQVIGAHAVYGDFLMESLLLQYKSIVELNTGLSLLPTYSFYRVYRRGHELRPHIDRPSCEISMTVSYGLNYCGQGDAWPIYMDGEQIILNPGDAAIYRGCEVKHWRDLLNVPQNSYHVQCFYHYVDINGPYSEYAYDKKNPSHLEYLQKTID